MTDFDWKLKYAERIETASGAIKQIKSGDNIFIGTGCAQPQHLVDAMVKYSSHIYDAHVIHLLTMGNAPYASEEYRDRFKMNSLFVA